MKALVLAGGLGTRLRPFTETMPKQLIPIANQPVLEHVLENIRTLGVREIGIVVGDWGPAIEARIGDGSRFGASITYLRQDRPLGLAHCVALARPFLGDDDFVMYLGDNVLHGGIGELAERFRDSGSDVHLAVARVDDPSSFGIAELDGHGRVRHLVEKPTDPRSDLALIGVYFFRPAIHRAVAAVTPSARGELEITDAVQLMVAEGAAVTASPYTGYWKDTGRVEDLLDCNAHLMQDLRADVRGEVGPGSRLTGPVRLAENATVIGSELTGPVAIGAGSLVEDCRLGPNTAVGSGCVLRGVDLTHSIVLDGTRLTTEFRSAGAVVSSTACVEAAVPSGRARGPLSPRPAESPLHAPVQEVAL